MANKLLFYGVLCMERVREVLRLFELGQSQRAIHRSTGVARSTIQEYLRIAELHGLSFERAKGLSDEELRALLRKKTPGRSRREVEEPDFGRVHRELHSRKGVTLELLWKEWNQESGGGYSYSTFCRRYREHTNEHSVWMRQAYKPGEKLLSDYSGETLSYWDDKGEERPVQIFVTVLGASNKIFAEATESQKLTHWVNSHIRALEYFGGVPEAVYIDNLKSGVTKSHRYEPEVNRTFAEFAAHYGTAIFPVRARKPQDKAKAEKAVQEVQRQILAPLRHVRFRSLAEMNTALRVRLKALNGRPMKDYGASRNELFEKLERGALKPLPALSFTMAQWRRARVSRDYHIQVGHHYYSVPYYHVKKEVWVKITEKLIEVFLGNERIASHRRSDVPYRFSTAEAHLPPRHKAVKSWTAESFIKWARSVGPHMEQLVDTLLQSPRYREQAYRSILGMQRLEKKYGASLTEKAAEIAVQKKHHSQRGLRLILEAIAEKENSPAPQEGHRHENVRGALYYH